MFGRIGGRNRHFDVFVIFEITAFQVFGDFKILPHGIADGLREGIAAYGYASGEETVLADNQHI